MNAELFLSAVVVSLSLNSAQAVVIEFTVKEAWEIAAEDFRTIGFTGFPKPTIITDQYLSEGLLFTDNNDLAINNVTVFPNDGSGMRGGQSVVDADVNLEFLSPQFNIAVDYPGAIQFELFFQGELIYTSNQFGGIGGPFFAGLVSTEPFDAARLFDWSDPDVCFDDLHFGIPSPGAISLLVLATLWPRSRRRR